MSGEQQPGPGRPYGGAFVRDVGVNFARHVRMRRAAMGMSQQHVVLSLEIEHGIVWHQTVMAKIEGGQRQVKLAEAYALADVLGIPLDRLVTGDVLWRPEDGQG